MPVTTASMRPPARASSAVPTATSPSFRSAPLNLAKYDARGLDVEASYRLPLSNIVESWPGTFSLHGFMTFYLQSVQESPFSPRVDVAGSNFFATSGAAATRCPTGS